MARVDSVWHREDGSAQRGRAVDFGCGVGRLTQALCSHFGTCDGVDIAPSMIAVAESYNRVGDRCRFHVIDDSRLSFLATGSVDFVYTAHVLQHMEPRYASDYVAEFLRVLRPGGAALIELPVGPVVGQTEPLDNRAFNASIVILNPPNNLLTGDNAVIGCYITNCSPCSWPVAGSNGWYHVTVGNHWMTEGGSCAAVDDARVELPEDIGPGASFVTHLNVRAPAKPGTYQLEIDLVQEGVAWFADKGSSPTTVRVRVRPKRRGRREPSKVGPAPAFEPRMEMYGTPEAELGRWVQSSGGRVLDVFDWDEISQSISHDWQRRGFVVIRDR